MEIITCILLQTISIVLFYVFFNSYAFGLPLINDPNLKAEVIYKGLERPTSMTFLGKDDILVAEKNGKVNRIVDKDISQYPVLDITSIVNSTGERGLLGIVSSRSDDGEGRKVNRDDKEWNIYVYFTEYANDTNQGHSTCMWLKCETEAGFVNSLYRYKYIDGKLVNPVLLQQNRLNSNDSIQHIGGALEIDSNHRIYFTTGDGRSCEYYEDCDLKFSNVDSGPAETGGIFFITDTNIADRNITQGDNVHQYAYGIRNSFGLDFDPVTGNLWDTENGPAFGDEINLVKPGFNSGWPKIQGVWPTSNHSQLFNNPPPGLPKGYYFTNPNLKQEIENASDFLKQNYSAPEFTWNHTVGLTSIKFFNSDKLGAKYENQLFVATFNDGLLYHFDLNGERNELLLKGKLKDKLANSDDELDDYIFARGLSSKGISDLEVGPDGYLYVLTYGINGTVYRIVTK